MAESGKQDAESRNGKGWEPTVCAPHTSECEADPYYRLTRPPLTNAKREMKNENNDGNL